MEGARSPKDDVNSTRGIYVGAFAGAIYLALWTQSLFFRSNEEHQASLSIAAIAKSNDDNFPLEVKTFLPDTCHEHVVHKFPTLTSLLSRGKDSSLGSDGGHWSACTHIQIYGTNFAAFFARHLAYGIQPKTVLEFGCGLGTTSDFLARFVPGGSKVVCVEPEAMLGEVFAGSKWFPQRPIQLAMLSFAPEAKSCSDKLFSTEMQFELVLSLEVAEHVPPEHTAELIERLARATSKYLVFSAARPGQGGTDRFDDSMHITLNLVRVQRKDLHFPSLNNGHALATAPASARDRGFN